MSRALDEIPEILQPSVNSVEGVDSRTAFRLFQQWLAFLSATTTTVVNIVTSSIRVTVTSLPKTFIVSGCLPPSLGFDICPAASG